MHIEPGLLAQTKIVAANAAALALLASQAPALLRRPTLWLRTGLAAAFFTLFMQAFHLPVGPSELHFIGAMPIYLLLGFLPTLFGFALGLGLQGLVFEPQDLVHLGANALSLMVPLIVLHKTLGERLAARSVSAAQILKLDGIYYAGVTLMVGFWLTQSETTFALADWLRFTASYLGVVALEPLVTLLLVRGVQGQPVLPAWARACLDERLTQAHA